MRRIACLDKIDKSGRGDVVSFGRRVGVKVCWDLVSSIFDIFVPGAHNHDNRQVLELPCRGVPPGDIRCRHLSAIFVKARDRSIVTFEIDPVLGLGHVRDVRVVQSDRLDFIRSWLERLDRLSSLTGRGLDDSVASHLNKIGTGSARRYIVAT